MEAPKAYVRQCARHAAVDALRVRPDLPLEARELEGLAARRIADTDDGDFDDAGHRDRDEDFRQPGPTGQQQWAPHEMLTDPRLIHAVQQLHHTERLVMLAWLETFPPPNSAQLAKILGIPSASAVRGYRRRALVKLRAIFSAPTTTKEGVSR